MNPDEVRVAPEAGSCSQLLVSGGWHSSKLLLNHLLQSPHDTQVRVDVAFFLPVENLLTIQIHFEPAIRAGGERNRDISAKSTKELVRHPRGGRVMFSSDAIHDVNKNFPLRSHLYPPSYELSAWTASKKACSLVHILQFPPRMSNGRIFSAVMSKRRPTRLAVRPLCSSVSQQDGLDIVVRGGIESAAGTAPIDLPWSCSTAPRLRARERRLTHAR